LISLGHVPLNCPISVTRLLFRADAR
jgi:hypothetical protein